MSDFGGNDDFVFDIRLDGSEVPGDAMDVARNAGEAMRRVLDQPKYRNLTAKMFDTNSLIGDLNALRSRVEAFKQTLSKQGANPELFAVLNQEIEKALRLERRLSEERIEIARDPELRAAYEQQSQQIGRTIRAELGATERLLKNQRSADQQAARDRQIAAAANYRREEDIRRRAHSKMVSDTQQFTTLENATIRTQGAKQVQEAQARARTRIEITRFAFRQIIFLERQLANAIRGAFSIAGSAFGSIQAGAARLGQVFRRSNNDINDGLQGALTQRERALSRSFRRQTNDIQMETARQRKAVDQLERQMSTGVLGVLTGRSRLGGALGAGALIGGGLTGANLFSQGLDRFQSLEKANLQLERMLGSATAARRQLDELDNWARGTPLALDLVTEIAVGLISMGTAAEDVLPRLTAITDAVAFTGGGADEIRRVGLAIRQVASAGRLLGQDFNQIAQALPGLNLNQLLADQITGGDTAAFLKMREAGEVSAQQFIEAFVAGVGANDSIGGSTASLAATLSGQISNLNAAWRRLGAAIITEFEGPLRASIRRLRDNLSLLARFVSGDVSPPFLALRSAIAGVAVAMGAIVAARAAVQVLQLLGVAARLALTPMGFLVTAIVGIGAAVGALRATNDNFRYITDGIRDLASEALVRGVQLLGGALRLFGRFLIDTVVPGLVRLGQAALPFVITAIRVLVAIVNAVLIPAVRAGFGYLVDTAIPAAIELAGALRGYLIPAVIALSTAWLLVNAPLSVVIGTFAAVSAALLILRANSETVRNFTDDLAESFVNLGSRLAGIGRTVGGAAATAFGALRDTLGELFARIDYQSLAVRILGFVNETGRLLGRAITSRLAVQAGVAIGAAAVALAGSFLLGFTEGVITGLPGAVDAFIDSLAAIVRAAGAPDVVSGLFSNAFTGVGALIAATIVASSILRSVRASGGRVAGAFSAGFIPGVRTGFTNAFRGLDALRGPEEAMARVARRQAAAYQSEFARIMRNNQRLGFQSQLVSTGAVNRDALDASAIRRLNAEQQRYIDNVGRATASAVLFRTTWTQVLRDTGNRWQALQDRVAQTGGWAAVGQRAGVSLVSAFGAALAGRQGGTSGLVGVVAASLGALAVGGPIVGGLTAAVGLGTLLWTELDKADAAAKRLLETTELMVGVFRDLRGEDIGVELTRQLRDATFAALDVAADPELASIIPTGFLSTAAEDIQAGNFELERAFRDVLQNMNVSLEDINLAFATFQQDPERFRRFLETPERALTILDGGANRSEEASARIRLAFTNIAAAVDAEGLDSTKFVNFFGALDTQARAFVASQEVLREEARVTAEELSNSFQFDRVGVGLGDLTTATTEVDSFLDKVSQLEQVSSIVSRVTGAIDQFGLTGINVFETVKAELEETGVAIDEGLLDVIRELIDQWLRAGLASDQAKRFMLIDEGIRADWEAMAGSVKKVGDNAEDTEEDLERASAAIDLVRTAATELNRQRTDSIRNQIEGVRSQLDGATDAAERAREAITAFFAPPKSASRLVDEAIGNLESVGSTIEDAMLKGGVQGDAAIRVALGGLNDTIATIIQQGFDDGLRTQAEFQALLAPLQGALREVIGESGARILSNVDFTEGITPAAGAQIAEALNFALSGNKIEAGVTAAFAAQSEVQRIQSQLDGLEASLDVEVQFDPQQLTDALLAAGLDASLLLGLDFTNVNQNPTALETQAAQFNASFGAAPAPAPTNTGPQINGDVTVVVPAPNAPAAGSAVVATLTSISYGRPLAPASYDPAVSYRPGVPQ